MNSQLIETMYADLQSGKSIEQFSNEMIANVHQVIEALDKGQLRVCEKTTNNSYVTLSWVKQAILIYFRLMKMQVIHSGDIEYFDKIPLKKWSEKDGVRVVPQALARFGSYVENGVILMPSFVNIGARVGSGTMVDTWATVGSCAQIGRHVHLSGGVGIGGVLEPLQASPVIIEDHCFLGSRSIVVEGVHVQEGAVLGAGVILTASTKIIDVTGPTEKVMTQIVPKNSVVIPGTLSKKFPAGEYGVPCALIIGQRKESTDLKTSLTQALRDYSVAV